MTASSHGKALILFAREPVQGQVKTRLAPTLGTDRALLLYRRMLQRQMRLVSDYPGVAPWLALDGDPAHPDLQNFPGHICAQQGKDIGQRMGNAFARVLANTAGDVSVEKIESAVLIGSDIPGISSDYLDDAFAALDGGQDVVLGPAHDGGYVLIGLKQAQAKVFEKVFEGIRWGGSAVLDDTRARISALGLRWQELSTLHDIDAPEDLVYLSGTGLDY